MASSIPAFLDTAGIAKGHLIAWSDSCARQNKNFYILCLWQFLITTGKMDIIDHIFPEPGYSCMHSARDFVHIEKNVKRTQNVYSLGQYQCIIA